MSVTIRVAEGEKRPRKYIVTIEGEDHSMGNLLARTLLSMKEVKFAYYEQPHPLEEKIVIFVELRSERTSIKKVLLRALEIIEKTNKEFRSKLLEEAQRKGLELET
ncbi:MAG: RpoL/Rpb11 RNA polymerase subunit family protein [Acidilobaceae archaeon]